MKSLKLGNLEVPVPIIQGGMGIGISLSGLASAVANMGGVGVISSVAIGLTDNKLTSSYSNNNIQGLKNEIRKAKEMTKGVLGVNIMSVLTDFSDMVKTSIDEKIDVIFSGAGLPMDLPKYLTPGSRTKLVPIVSSGRAASILAHKWHQNHNYLPDAFVVEGPKAGGHLGFKANDIFHADFSLEKLVEEVGKITQNIREKFKKEIPIIAAGGIYSGQDAFQIIDEGGASAVQLGSRFIATEECDASDKFKQAYVNSKEKDIQIIKSPVGMPARALVNDFLKDAFEGKKKPKSCSFRCMLPCNPKTTKYCIASALYEAFRGNLSEGFVFTGANAGRINHMTTVKQIFDELVNDYQKVKQDVIKRIHL